MKDSSKNDEQSVDHKYEPGTIDGFEIAGTESNASSSDVNDFSPQAATGKATDVGGVENNKAAVSFLIEEDDVDLDLYYPGVSLKLPVPVIDKLKLYVDRLERTRGRYPCMASFSSCTESFDDFQQFRHHISHSHSQCRLYRCIFCGHSIPFDLVRSHIDEHFKFFGSFINRFPCPYCLEHVEGNRVRDLERHMKSRHADSLVKYPFCRFCDELFTDALDYCHHLERNSNVLFHCPFDKCLVKSPDKMLIVNHIATYHEDDPKRTHYFRSTRHFTCGLSKSTDNKLRVSSQVEQETEADDKMRVILLTCPVCDSFTTRDYAAFLIHLTKCNVGADGEVLEISQDESEVEFMLYMCSNCTATSTLKSTLEFHLRAGLCKGMKASILEEHVVQERSGPLPPQSSSRRRRQSSGPAAQAAPAVQVAEEPPDVAPSDVVSTASQEQSSSTGSTDALLVIKEEPVFLDSLIGSAMAKFDRQQLLSDADIFADFSHFAKLKEVALDLGQMEIAVYSAMGGEHVFLCPKCSQHFSKSSATVVLRLGVHVFTEHYSIPAAVAHRSVPALQLQVQYLDGRSELLPKDNVPMVIKDEPPTPSIVSTVGQVDIDDIEWRGVSLQFSENTLATVSAPMESEEDRVLLRNCIVTYSCVQLSVNRHDKYRCNLCKYISASFMEIRRHVVRRHCDMPERITVQMMLLARQQVYGSHQLITDDVYDAIIKLPPAEQTSIHYRITSYIKRTQKRCKGKIPTEFEINQTAKTLAKMTPGDPVPIPEEAESQKPPEQNETGKKKEKGILKTVFKSWRDKKKSKAQKEDVDGPQKGKPGKLMPSIDDDVDIDASSVTAEEIPDKEESKEEEKYGAVMFNEEMFLASSAKIKMDQGTVTSVIKKMAAVSLAKIIVRILPSGRCAFSCTCGEYQEEVQSTAVTDGPRRHALRSHVRISKVHWSLCLQATSLVLPKMDEAPAASRKRRESEQGPTPPRETKKPRIEVKEKTPPIAAPRVTPIAPPQTSPSDNFVMVAGYKLRGIDAVSRPLDFLQDRDDNQLLQDGFMGYSVGSVKWQHFSESKPDVVADANANILRDRCTVFCHYRVYLRNDKDGGRSHVCSACGFASSYTSRDVRRHIMVAHLGVNVQFVTSLLNACDSTNHVLSFSSSPTQSEKSEKSKKRLRAESREEPKEKESEEEAKKAEETERADRKKLVGHRRAPAATEEEDVEAPLPQARHVRKLVKRCQRAGMTLRYINHVPDKASPSRSGRSFLDIPAILKDAELQPVVCLEMMNDQATGPQGKKKDDAKLSKPDVDPDGLCALKITKNNSVNFKCSKCAYVRDNRWSVFNHLALQHANPNEKGRYKCPRCSAWFNFSHVFSRHLTQVHQLKNFEIAKHENGNWKRSFAVLEMR